MSRPLDTEEQAIWERIAASVRPIRHRDRLRPIAPPSGGQARARAGALPNTSHPAAVPAGTLPPATRPASPPVRRTPVTDTLDAGWDRRLAGGRVNPDAVIDLHGHTLDSAWRYLDHGLDRAVRDGRRVILLITGKPRPVDRTGDQRRGIIRDKIGDWLGTSRFAGDIAAVRHAHPRHGGTGALYVILRRRR